MAELSAALLDKCNQIKALLEKHLDTDPSYPQSDQRFEMGEALSEFQSRTRWVRDDISREYNTNPAFRALKQKANATLSVNELTEVFRTRGIIDPHRVDTRRKQIEICLLFIALHPDLDFKVTYQNNTLTFRCGSQELHTLAAHNPNLRVHIAYYWRHKDERQDERVGYGIVQTPLDTEQQPIWHKTILTLHYASHPSITLQVQNGELIDGLLYLWLKDVDNQETHKVWTQITINYTGGTRALLVGTYSTAHRRPRAATAGIMIWRQMASLAEALRYINDYQRNDLKIVDSVADQSIATGSLRSNSQSTPPHTIPIEISYYLAHQRLDVERLEYETLTKLPFAEEAGNIRHYVGHYQGYTIRHDNYRVNLFSLDILGNGRVVVRYKNAPHPTDIYGNILYIGTSVVIELDYQPELDFFRQSYVLQTNRIPIDGCDCLLGIVIGLSSDLKHPVAGRILLKKLTTTQAKIESVGFTEYWMQDSDLDILAILEVLAGESAAEDRPMTDSFVRDLLDEFQQQLPTNRSESAGYQWQGRYSCFIGERSADSPYTILQYTVSISPNDDVLLERQDIRLKGSIEIINGRALLIRFNDQQNHYFGTLLFKISEQGRTVNTHSFKRLFGVFSRVHEGRVEAFSAIMTPHLEPIRLSEIYPNQTQQAGSEIITEFHHLDATYERGVVTYFDKLDQHLMGLISFMDGAANRSLRMDAVPDRPFLPRKKEFRRIPFYAACYLALLHKEFTHKEDPSVSNERIQLIKQHLNEAFKMGFAAQSFAGIELTRQLASNPEEIAQQFGSIGVKSDAQVQQMKKEIVDLLDDRELLLLNLERTDGLSQDKLAPRVHLLWPHVFPQKQTEPETT